MASILDFGSSIVDDFVPGGSTILGALKTVAKWLGVKGKTPTAAWPAVQGLFVPYFDAVYNTYFNENYTYKVIDLERGSFDLYAPGAKGIWTVGMVLFDKKTNADKGIVAWGRYGTMENKIGNGGVGDPVGQQVTKDVGKGFPSARELYQYASKVYKLNADVVADADLPTQEKPKEEESKGIPIDFKISLASISPYMQYIIIGVVITALVVMFKKK